MHLKIEINTREHFALQGLQRRQLIVQNPWFAGDSEIVTFTNDELMATKLRALYQRRKGRDLFDLWLCLDRNLIEPAKVVDCFLEYMRREGHSISRAEFEQNLHKKQHDRAFLHDIGPLLRPGSGYDSTAATAMVRETLIALLPGEPWRGVEDEDQPRGRKRRRK